MTVVFPSIAQHRPVTIPSGHRSFVAAICKAAPHDRTRRLLAVLSSTSPPGRTRTFDHRLKRPLLYQLSYRGNGARVRGKIVPQKCQVSIAEKRRAVSRAANQSPRRPAPKTRAQAP